MQVDAHFSNAPMLAFSSFNNFNRKAEELSALLGHFLRDLWPEGPAVLTGRPLGSR